MAVNVKVKTNGNVEFEVSAGAEGVLGSKAVETSA